MGDNTKIEWTEASWNPTIGCSKVSAGCDHCYAIGVVHRAMQPAHVGLTIAREGERPDWTGEIRYVPERLDQPLKWKRSRKIFVNSLSDLFHPDLLNLRTTDRFGHDFPVLAEIVAVMVRAEWHTFQVLTKRPQIMASVLRHPMFKLDVNAILLRDGHPVMPGGMSGTDTAWPAHIWWGTSIDEDRYSFRANHLRDTPAAVRFLSLEPLLGALPSLDLTGIDWVIVGGESGPGARPMHPAWVRDLRDRCVKAGIPYFFKQWGSWGPEAPKVNGVYQMGKGFALANDGTLYNQQDIRWPDGPRRGEALRAGHDRAQLTAMYRMNKKAAGRDLDGRTWDEYPTL